MLRRYISGEKLQIYPASKQLTPYEDELICSGCTTPWYWRNTLPSWFGGASPCKTGDCIFCQQPFYSQDILNLLVVMSDESILTFEEYCKILGV